MALFLITGQVSGNTVTVVVVLVFILYALLNLGLLVSWCGLLRSSSSPISVPLYDFPKLVETMEKELPVFKRHVLLLAIPNMSLKTNQRKNEALQANIWGSALVSGCGATIPISGHSVSVDITILVREIRMYYQAFGLNNESLQSLADEHVCQWRS